MAQNLFTEVVFDKNLDLEDLRSKNGLLADLVVKIRENFTFDTLNSPFINHIRFSEILHRFYLEKQDSSVKISEIKQQEDWLDQLSQQGFIDREILANRLNNHLITNETCSIQSDKIKLNAKSVVFNHFPAYPEFSYFSCSADPHEEPLLIKLEEINRYTFGNIDALLKAAQEKKLVDVVVALSKQFFESNQDDSKKKELAQWIVDNTKIMDDTARFITISGKQYSARFLKRLESTQSDSITQHIKNESDILTLFLAIYYQKGAVALKDYSDQLAKNMSTTVPDIDTIIKLLKRLQRVGFYKNGDCETSFARCASDFLHIFLGTDFVVSKLTYKGLNEILHLYEEDENRWHLFDKFITDTDGLVEYLKECSDDAKLQEKAIARLALKPLFDEKYITNDKDLEKIINVCDEKIVANVLRIVNLSQITPATRPLVNLLNRVKNANKQQLILQAVIARRVKGVSQIHGATLWQKCVANFDDFLAVYEVVDPQLLTLFDQHGFYRTYIGACEHAKAFVERIIKKEDKIAFLRKLFDLPPGEFENYLEKIIPNQEAFENLFSALQDSSDSKVNSPDNLNSKNLYTVLAFFHSKFFKTEVHERLIKFIFIKTLSPEYVAAAFVQPPPLRLTSSKFAKFAEFAKDLDYWLIAETKNDDNATIATSLQWLHNLCKAYEQMLHSHPPSKELAEFDKHFPSLIKQLEQLPEQDANSQALVRSIYKQTSALILNIYLDKSVEPKALEAYQKLAADVRGQAWDNGYGICIAMEVIIGAVLSLAVVGLPLLALGIYHSYGFFTDPYRQTANRIEQIGNEATIQITAGKN